MTSDLISLDHPLQVPVPWSATGPHVWMMIGYMAFLTPALILNTLQVIVLTRDPHLKANAAFRVIRYLAFEDLGLAIACFLSCATNVADGHFAGYEIGCVIEAWHLTFFTLMTAYTLALMAHLNHRRLLDIKYDAQVPLFRLHVLFFIVAAVLATLANVWPGKSGLTLSGSYCMPNLHEPLEFVIVYVFGVGTALTSIAYNYFCIFRHIRTHEAVMRSRTNPNMSVSGVAVGRGDLTRRVSERMVVFVAAYMVAYTPCVLCTLIELVTGRRAPAILDSMAALGLHLNNVSDPILYFILNKDARLAVYKLLSFDPRFGTASSKDAITSKKIRSTTLKDTAGKHPTVSVTASECPGLSNLPETTDIEGNAV